MFFASMLLFCQPLESTAACVSVWSSSPAWPCDHSLTLQSHLNPQAPSLTTIRDGHSL